MIVKEHNRNLLKNQFLGLKMELKRTEDLSTKLFLHLKKNKRKNSLILIKKYFNKLKDRTIKKRKIFRLLNVRYLKSIHKTKQEYFNHLQEYSL